MKVALYSTGSPDYLIDIVSDGMIRLLGRASIHMKYNVTAPPSTTLDHLFKGFGGPNAFAFEAADLLVASVRCDPQVVLGWRRKTGKGTVAVVDGEDDPSVRGSWLGLCKTYFKREMLEGVYYPPGVRPLPMAAIPEDRPPAEERTRQVIFQGNLTSPIRRELWAALAEMGFGGPPGNVSKWEYNRALSRTLVGVSARGAGWDTYRYWETPYFGCALLSERPRIAVPGNFIAGQEAVFFEDAGSFKSRLRSLLSDLPRIRAIGEAGKAACLARHLSTHRAATVLGALA